MDYLKIFEESYQEVKSFDECLDTKLEYVGEYIFNFTTYDGEMSEFLAGKALEVCDAITSRKTFEYIEDKESYKWFLTMCNMPFFSSKIDWGTSIRGCWWDTYKGIRLESLGIIINGQQIEEIEFNEDQWALFLVALKTFAASPAQEGAMSADSGATKL